MSHYSIAHFTDYLLQLASSLKPWCQPTEQQMKQLCHTSNISSNFTSQPGCVPLHNLEVTGSPLLVWFLPAIKPVCTGPHDGGTNFLKWSGLQSHWLYSNEDTPIQTDTWFPSHPHQQQCYFCTNLGYGVLNVSGYFCMGLGSLLRTYTIVSTTVFVMLYLNLQDVNVEHLSGNVNSKVHQYCSY